MSRGAPRHVNLLVLACAPPPPPPPPNAPQLNFQLSNFNFDPTSHHNHRYVTRADFPNDGVFQKFPNEEGNPGGFVNALTTRFGRLAGEAVLDPARDELLVRFQSTNANANANAASNSRLVRIGLRSSVRHRDLMQLTTAPSYHVTQNEFQKYIFEKVGPFATYLPSSLPTYLATSFTLQFTH